MSTVRPDTTAVSPVVGTVLVVAIVVMLASVFGVLATDYVHSTNDIEEAPDLWLEAEQFGDETQEVQIYHHSGDTVTDLDRISVLVDGERVSDTGADWSNTAEALGAGSSLYIAADQDEDGYLVDDDEEIDGDNEALDAGTEITVVWVSEDSDSSATLLSYEVESR